MNRAKHLKLKSKFWTLTEVNTFKKMIHEQLPLPVPCSHCCFAIIADLRRTYADQRRYITDKVISALLFVSPQRSDYIFILFFNRRLTCSL